jgi:hypothetical protein
VPSPLYPPDLGDELRELRRVANAAWTAARQRGALSTIQGLMRVIIGGQITVEDEHQVSLVRMGHFTTNDDHEVTGFQVARGGGEEAMLVAQDADGAFWMRLRDGNQKDVIRVGNDGLDRPLMNIPMYRSQSTGWASITDLTLTPQFFTEFYRQHAQLTVRFTVYVDGGAQVAFDLFDGDVGTAVASTPTITSVGDFTLSAPIVGAHLDRRVVSLRAVRLVGTGSAFMQIRSAYGEPIP